MKFDTDRRFADINDYIDNIFAIKSVWNNFKVFLMFEIYEKNGVISANDFNKSLIKAKSKYNKKISENENIAIEGFFDSAIFIMEQFSSIEDFFGFIEVGLFEIEKMRAIKK